MSWNRSTEARCSRASDSRFSLALVCIALMLFATLAQALDCHELGIAYTASHSSAAVPSPSSPGYCLVCVAAHSPSVIAHVTFVYSVAKSYASCPRIATNLLSLLPIFGLSVRPPPVV